MEILSTPIQDLLIIKPKVYKDERGFFMETYSEKLFQQMGIIDHFVQDNLSSSKKGTIRGLHYQNPPYAQAKLVTVWQGQVLDVAVDLRTNSPTYGQHFSLILDANEPTFFYIPTGFAHGFSVLSEDCLFYYKCSNYYHKPSEGGVRWNDPTLNIDWKIDNPILSEKDQHLPLLTELPLPKLWLNSQ